MDCRGIHGNPRITIMGCHGDEGRCLHSITWAAWPWPLHHRPDVPVLLSYGQESIHDYGPDQNSERNVAQHPSYVWGPYTGPKLSDSDASHTQQCQDGACLQFNWRCISFAVPFAVLVGMQPPLPGLDAILPPQFGLFAPHMVATDEAGECQQHHRSPLPIWPAGVAC
eukprot:354698-Chlamydomonas_euryale.AAC.5